MADINDKVVTVGSLSVLHEYNKETYETKENVKTALKNLDEKIISVGEIVTPIQFGGTGSSDGAIGLKNLFASGDTILSSYQYGDELPEAGIVGRIFFKRLIVEDEDTGNTGDDNTGDDNTGDSGNTGDNTGGDDDGSDSEQELLEKYDVNMDGVITEDDLGTIILHIVGDTPIMDEEILSRADVNKDGVIDDNDAIEINDYLQSLPYH